MNVCHFISSKGLGRGEFYIDLVNEMSQKEELNISLLIPKGSKFLNRVSNKINIIEYSSKDTRFNPFLYLELYKIFNKYTFDIVHTHFAKSTEIFYRINKILNLKHVATKHNPRKGKIFNKIKFVTAVSDDVKNSIDNKDVKIIYNGINLEDRILNEKSNEKFTIRAIGRLEKVKGFDVLIRELEKVKKDYILEIIGDGLEYNNLNKLVNELNLDKKVKLIGYKENIIELVHSSDLIVISSISEGFSLVALETLFYGHLLISTNVGICKKILTKNLLVENSEFSKRINNVIDNYESYIHEFSKIKIKYQDKFLLTKVVEQYINYYKFVKGKE